MHLFLSQYYDIAQVTDALVRTLVRQVRDMPGGGCGIPNFLDSMAKALPYPRHNCAIMGFTGKNLESANFMMLSLPDRLYDFGEAGWQQEHWSIAPRRGYGLHRGWLPWVSTSHLAGIYDMQENNPEIFALLVEEDK
jgi:hypothetical protein